MKVRIISADWHLSQEILEGTVTFEIGGLTYQAFSCSYRYPIGQEIDVGFTHMSRDHTWEERFKGNPENKKALFPKGGWAYDGFGQITGIKPVVADFGPLSLELGWWTNDERVIGEFIYWPITELEIYPKKDS